ncbi:hypothetical protein SNOG_12998 [Parastagonospora nodorum SN15]|uniref:Uncharacterized protein n=1 Tax=Phaeosphaeria nodorum (strain SN15 / ATCC MYA-4574 / FGSC 10173) TaxID=321614 RepID=Q0U5G6_PHANO|nr:hypothetical protein SNOG_12998 [Parastagonospora nodorum SN15]EAT79798.1 hypothetical protein SNOG_12998 [Parastagonospora nodorum SN15]
MSATLPRRNGPFRDCSEREMASQRDTLDDVDSRK